MKLIAIASLSAVSAFGQSGHPVDTTQVTLVCDVGGITVDSSSTVSSTDAQACADFCTGLGAGPFTLESTGVISQLIDDAAAGCIIPANYAMSTEDAGCITTTGDEAPVNGMLVLLPPVLDPTTVTATLSLTLAIGVNAGTSYTFVHATAGTCDGGVVVDTTNTASVDAPITADNQDLSVDVSSVYSTFASLNVVGGDPISVWVATEDTIGLGKINLAITETKPPQVGIAKGCYWSDGSSTLQTDCAACVSILSGTSNTCHWCDIGYGSGPTGGVCGIAPTACVSNGSLSLTAALDTCGTGPTVPPGGDTSAGAGGDTTPGAGGDTTPGAGGDTTPGAGGNTGDDGTPSTTFMGPSTTTTGAASWMTLSAAGLIAVVTASMSF